MGALQQMAEQSVLVAWQHWSPDLASGDREC
jgi:hypothetical protein